MNKLAAILDEISEKICSGDTHLIQSDIFISERNFFTVAHMEQIGNFINQEETPLSPTARF